MMIDSQYGLVRWPSLIPPLRWSRRSNRPNVMWLNNSSFWFRFFKHRNHPREVDNTRTGSLAHNFPQKKSEEDVRIVMTNCSSDCAGGVRDGENPPVTPCAADGRLSQRIAEYVMAATTNLGVFSLFFSMFRFFTYTHTVTAFYLSHFIFQGL